MKTLKGKLIPVIFQVRSTKTFKQYNGNQIVVFSIVIWVSHTKLELFLHLWEREFCEKLKSTRKTELMKI